jgi:hypothetical protein
MHAKRLPFVQRLNVEIRLHYVLFYSLYHWRIRSPCSRTYFLPWMHCNNKQVRAFHMSSEHGCSGIINAKCSNHPEKFFSTIFEALAMSLYMKARDMHIQVILHSINVSKF